MASLFATTPAASHRLPAEIRLAIIQLNAEHAPLSPHENATICQARFGRRPSPHTVKRILAEESLPAGVPRPFPPYHAIGDAAERRLAVIRLHSEGWTITSIAGYARFRHWRLYGERGLAGDTVAVWLYGEHLTIALADEALAKYGVTYQPGQRQLATVVEEQRFETPYQSPLTALWELGEDAWLTVVRVAPYASRRPRPMLDSHQLRRFADEVADVVTG